MSKIGLEAIRCDDCGERQVVNEPEGVPLMSALSKGWVEIEHRDPDDHLGIHTTHYCPECRDNHVTGERFEVSSESGDEEVPDLRKFGSHETFKGGD